MTFWKMRLRVKEQSFTNVAGAVLKLQINAEDHFTVSESRNV